MDLLAMQEYLPLFTKAMWLTLRIGWMGILLSIVIGLVTALIRHFNVPVLKQITGIYIELFRNIAFHEINRFLNAFNPAFRTSLLSARLPLAAIPYHKGGQCTRLFVLTLSG